MKRLLWMLALLCLPCWAQFPLRYATASQEVPLGYFVDKTDGDTAEDGLTISNTDIDIWKAGATTIADKNSGGATHIAGGIYYAVLDATDTDTLGPLVVFVHASGALTVRLECVVYPAVVYDALFAGTDNLQTDMIQVEGSDATDTLGAAQTGDAYALANNGTYGLSALETLVDDLEGRLTALRAGYLDNLSGGAAALEATAQSILTDTGTTIPGTITTMQGDVTDILADTNELQANQDWNPWDAGTRTLTAPTNLSIPSAGDNADAVWDEVIAGHATAGSTGAALSAATAPTASDVADAVWEETITDHSGTAGSTAEQLAAAGAGGDPWATPLPGSYTSGQAGYLIGNLLDSLDENVEAMLGTGFNESTHSLPAIAGRLWQGDGTVQITEDYGGENALGFYTDDANTIGVPNAVVRFYEKNAYDAGGRIWAATTRTDSTGGFTNNPVYLDPGNYYEIITHPDYVTAMHEFTVSD
jgi:hypothetical protein